MNLAVLPVLAGVIVPWSIHFPGKTRTVTRTVAPQGASPAAAELNLCSWKLEVDGGEEGLFGGTFTYNVKDWEPKVEYSVRGDEGRLSVNPTLEPDRVRAFACTFQGDGARRQARRRDQAEKT